ncbi:MAG: type I glutamate--ammonia ligase [Anaerolineae bacterium]
MALSDSERAVIERTQRDNISYIDLQFTDITGMVKVVQIPARRLEQALTQGVWFDGSALEGFARVAESDMYLRPDPLTYTPIAWERGPQRVARFICDVYTPTGDPFPGDPRFVLRRAVHLAADLGYHYLVSPELEFYLFRGEGDDARRLHPRPEDRYSYFDVSDSQAQAVRRGITEALEQMGISIDSGHHEVGGGQHELDLTPLEALPMADAIMTARLAVKSIAREFGLHATFMPKPIAGAAGSGMHTHQRLVLSGSDTNVFAAPDEPYGLSELARAFIAGQLAHARGMCAVLAPLVNSYKRLAAGLEAPVYITWAQLNRAALIRVPRELPNHRDRVRVELRCVDPSCNPYLALSVMLHAGLDGIRQKMSLQSAAEEELVTFNARRRHIATLPNSLYEALEAMESSELVSEALGLTIFERFLEAKRLEWNDYVLSVSPWELDRYLNNY